MKIDRLIGIIIILLQQDKITAPELSERFEVSKRTINRDIEDLCRAGVPIVTTQGFGGGISISEGYKIDKSLLTQDELQTVFTGLKGIDSVSKFPSLEKLVEKLSRRDRQIVVEDVIHIDLASHYQSTLTPKIDAIKQAILSHHTISFQYYYEKGMQERTIEPCHIIYRWSSWYVFGFCLKRKGFRLFKLNRLWDLRTDEETFPHRDIPKDALHFDSYFSSDTIHLKALFLESEKHRLIEKYGIGCYIPKSGRVLFEQDFTSYENMRSWIFSFGGRVHILEPESLRIEQVDQARHILEMYKEHDSEENFC